MKGKEPKPPIEKKKENELRQEIVRRIDVAYQAFDDARGDASRLEKLKEGVDQSLEKYREAVKRGELALPEEELRLMRLQRNIEKELMSRQARPARPASTRVERGEPEKFQLATEQLKRINEALNIAINNIEMYYKDAGDDKEKIENALNAAESVLNDIDRAVKSERWPGWSAPEQKRRLWNMHKEIREKLKKL